ARIMDETGVVTTEDLTDYNDLEESFDLDEELAADLDAREADDEVKAQVIQVDESTDTNGVAIYAFELEETEGINATLEELEVTISAGYDVDGDGSFDADDDDDGDGDAGDGDAGLAFEVVDGEITDVSAN